MGARSSTTPMATWTWSSDNDDHYRGMVDDCGDAVVQHVRRCMNTVCRARVGNEVRAHVANEVRACFSALMREAMEPVFLDAIINEILD